MCVCVLGGGPRGVLGRFFYATGHWKSQKEDGFATYSVLFSIVVITMMKVLIIMA